MKHKMLIQSHSWTTLRKHWQNDVQGFFLNCITTKESDLSILFCPSQAIYFLIFLNPSNENENISCFVSGLVLLTTFCTIWDQRSCKDIEPSSRSCAYTSTGACFQSKCRFGTVLEILLGIILTNKDFICSAAPQSHLSSAVARRGWDWRGINAILSWNTLSLDQLTCMGKLSPCSPKCKSPLEAFFLVVKAEGINRCFVGEKYCHAPWDNL